MSDIIGRVTSRPFGIELHGRNLLTLVTLLFTLLCILTEIPPVKTGMSKFSSTRDVSKDSDGKLLYVPYYQLLLAVVIFYASSALGHIVVPKSKRYDQLLSIVQPLLFIICLGALFIPFRIESAKVVYYFISFISIISSLVFSCAVVLCGTEVNRQLTASSHRSTSTKRYYVKTLLVSVGLVVSFVIHIFFLVHMTHKKFYECLIPQTIVGIQFIAFFCIPTILGVYLQPKKDERNTLLTSTFFVFFIAIRVALTLSNYRDNTCNSFLRKDNTLGNYGHFFYTFLKYLYMVLLGCLFVWVSWFNVEKKILYFVRHRTSNNSLALLCKASGKSARPSSLFHLFCLVYCFQMVMVLADWSMPGDSFDASHGFSPSFIVQTIETLGSQLLFIGLSLIHI